MMEAITLFLRLTKDARTAPAISGKLAIKPQSRESNRVPVDEVNYIFTTYCWRAVNIKTMMSSIIWKASCFRVLLCHSCELGHYYIS
jgi:hypothetical protein